LNTFEHFTKKFDSKNLQNKNKINISFSCGPQTTFLPSKLLLRPAQCFEFDMPAIHSQTCINDHMWTTTTLNQAQAILVQNLSLNNDHLSTTTSGYLILIQKWEKTVQSNEHFLLKIKVHWCKLGIYFVNVQKSN